MKIKYSLHAILSLFILGLFHFQSSAQTNTSSETENFDQGFRLGFGINSGYAFQEPYHFSYGADMRIQYDLSERFSILLTSGYTNITISGNDNDLAFIPVKAGYKTFVWANKFYAMGEIGAAFGTTDTYRKTSVIVSPSVGFANKFIDVSIRYENYADFPNIKDNGSTGDGLGLVAVRLAYGFQL
jgi:hypothetical protein